MIATIKSAALLGAGLAGSVVLGSSVGRLDETTPISLGAALTCTGVVFSCTWWLSRYYSRQQAMHKDNQKRFRRIEHALKLLLEKNGIFYDLGDEP